MFFSSRRLCIFIQSNLLQRNCVTKFVKIETIGTITKLSKAEIFCHIINPLLTKLVLSRCLNSGLVICAFLLTWTSSRSIKTQKRTWPIYNYLERTSLVNNAYCKIPKISPRVYILQRPFLRGLFLKGLMYGGKFTFQNRLG